MADKDIDRTAAPEAPRAGSKATHAAGGALGAVAGVVAGAATGALAGPIGLVAGAVAGGVLGGMAGAGMVDRLDRNAAKYAAGGSPRDLDEAKAGDKPMAGEDSTQAKSDRPR
jgi:phage tail tape-measure protein